MNAGATRRLARASTSWALGGWLLAVLAYVPALTSRLGRMPTDTKLFLYLDPGRLIADAPFSWDTRQFAGWVPHQTIAYLWPSGPWYWVFDRFGVPDWVAHRLWIGTILVLGGLGVRWAARQLGLAPGAALVAALVYQLSPYVLPYVSRTSVMLLPWAAVGWLVGLTVRACGRTRWRDAALFALVVLTVGAVNATATALIAPAPILWLVHAAWQRTITWRTAALTAAKLGGLSLVVSLWWIVMLMVQGRHGADVLSFSETLSAVSLTSTGAETLRGLGYWLFYVRDPYAFTTSASVPYMSSGVVILAGYALVVVCVAGLALVRWSQRRYAALLAAAGLLLAVGVHPIDDPSPLMRPLASSGLGLALRSSTRALPVFTFGMALGAGSLAGAVLATRWRWRAVAPAAIGVLAFVNLPALRTGELVDRALERDQDVPAAWHDAVDDLADTSEQRVMQLPGSEFGAFRWGYTVDPPLPGLADEPLVTRDLLPLGSPGAMDLLYALDNRFQSGTQEAASVVAVARLLGVDTIWVANDLAFDRFRTPRPEVVSDFFGRDIEGLGTPVAYGTPEVNVPDIAMVDEQQLADDRIGTPLAPVELVPVDDPQAVIRASETVVVVAGSGDGIVDAAAAGLLDGSEAVLYAADLDADELADLTAVGNGLPVRLIVTDSNRDRAQQWRGSQDVSGFTESGGPGADVTEEDEADQRLQVFATETGSGRSGGNQTTATLDGGLVVTASGYGEPFAYRPEDRPAMAVDGDPSTAWVVADRADPIGESIDVAGWTDGVLGLVQSQDPAANRRITEVRVEGDLGSRTLALDERSWSAAGQPVRIDDLASTGSAVRLVITAVADRPEGTDSGPSAVGFAELGPVATEVVVVPGDALATLPDDVPLEVVLTRDRTRATNRWRSDPEASLVRELTLPGDRDLSLTVTLRLDARAADAVLAQWTAAATGTAPVALASDRLTGVPAAAGASAVDASSTTTWTTPFGRAVGSALTIGLDPAVQFGSFTLDQPTTEPHSPITSLHAVVNDATGAVVLDELLAVPTADAAGRSTVVLPASISGAQLTFTIDAVETRTTVDRRYAEVVELPASIVELGGLPLAPPITSAAPAPCRDDLLTIDGTPVGLAIDAADVAALVAGDAVDVTTCDGEAIALAAGTHRLASAAGLATGVDVDRVVLADGSSDAGDAGAGGAAPAVTVVERTRTERTVEVGPCPAGCWLILGEGYNDAWTAELSPVDGTDGSSLGAPRQISGGFNGWWLPPHDGTVAVTMTWTPQESLDIALLVATLGVLACMVLAVLDRRRRPLPFAIDTPRLAAPWAQVPRRRALVVAAVLVAGAGLTVSPAWGVLALAPAAVVVLQRRPALLAVSAAVVGGAIGAIVLVRQHRWLYFVNAGWPGNFEDLHRPAVMVVVLLVAGCLLDDRTGEPVEAPAPLPPG